MLAGVCGILVGYSGGADSSALLYKLSRYCKAHGIYLRAIHINHGIRGDEARRDARFCKEECERLEIDFTLEEADIPTLSAKSGRGLEEEARAYRYDAFLRQINADSRINCVATAHNADDNLETVLFNLTRGSGINGMCGIPPVRMLGNAKLIRPLISLQKSDIVGYCEENGVKYIFDSTNDDTAYTRNFIRHELLPPMRRLNPSLASAICRATSSLRADSEYLDGLADKFVEEHSINGALKAEDICSAHRAVATRAISKLYSMTAKNAALEYVHIDAILRLAMSRKNGAKLDLPNNVRAVFEGGMLLFTDDVEDDTTEFCYTLHDGINRFDDLNFAVLIARDCELNSNFEKDNEYLKNIYKLSIHTKVNSAKIKGALNARSRHNGDAYVFGNMTRKLKKLYNDKKLSSFERQRLPIICDEVGIVWVPGFGVADRVRNISEAELNIIYYYN